MLVNQMQVVPIDDCSLGHARCHSKIASSLQARKDYVTVLLSWHIKIMECSNCPAKPCTWVENSDGNLKGIGQILCGGLTIAHYKQLKSSLSHHAMSAEG